MRGTFGTLITPDLARLVAVAGLAALVLAMVPGEVAATWRPATDGHGAVEQSSSWRMCQGRTADPALGLLAPDQPTLVTIVSQDEGWNSDLELIDFAGNVESIQTDAKNHVGTTYALTTLMSASAADVYELGIYVHENGQTFHSTSANAIATRGDGPNDRYICFEDGGDTDWDDIVLHIVIPTRSDELMALEPHPKDGFEVDVSYDDLYMTSIDKDDYSARNNTIARGVETRALKTLKEYHDLLDASGEADAVPTRVQIVIRRKSFQYGVVPNDGARTECETPISELGIEISADKLMSQTEATADSLASGSFTPEPGMWIATTIDHELWHTIQCTRTAAWAFAWQQLLTGNGSHVEGSATAAQDAIADTDDSGKADEGTFLLHAKILFGQQGTPTAVQSNPRIAVSSSGVAVAVWYDKRSSQTNIYSARLPIGLAPV